MELVEFYLLNTFLEEIASLRMTGRAPRLEKMEDSELWSYYTMTSPQVYMRRKMTTEEIVAAYKRDCHNLMVSIFIEY